MSAGSSSSMPGTGAVKAGSTAITSASLPASSDPTIVAEAERLGPTERAEPQPLERRQHPARLDAGHAAGVLHVEPDPHRREDRQVRTAGHVRPEPERDARVQVPPERHHPRREEQVRHRTVRDTRPGLDQAVELAIGQVDGVGENGPLAETAGAVVDIDVVERLREQPRDLGDLAAVLREVRLPVRTGGGGQRRGLAQQVGRARDGEPRRDGVAQAAIGRPRAIAR